MSRMQSVSEICESEMSILECRTPNVFTNCGTASKEAIKGLAKPFVICSETPNSIENMKNIAICFLRNNLKAFNPNASPSDFFSETVPVLHSGNVKA
ncbi:MAG: hypothetical protein BWZ06_00371 [Bacteroidetes bacterium ADurb.BinA261]|nr:MAG: hypothetical protein BWZ06_00371 [Bacteroidetes bacterium ADurb.BinA261]